MRCSLAGFVEYLIAMRRKRPTIKPVRDCFTSPSGKIVMRATIAEVDPAIADFRLLYAESGMTSGLPSRKGLLAHNSTGAMYWRTGLKQLRNVRRLFENRERRLFLGKSNLNVCFRN